MKHGLHELFAPPEGFVFCRGAGCTYSANERTWAAIRQVLCGRDVGRQIAFEEGKSFRLYVQQGEYSGTPQNGLVPVSPAEGCLHAKLYALEYQSLDGPAVRYRILAASANLTNEEELNLFARFDSCEAGRNSMGRQAAALLRRVLREAGERTVFEEDPGFLDRLAQAGFDGAAQLFLPASPQFQSAFEQDLQDARGLIVVSPFLSEGVLKRLSSRAEPVSVVSRAQEIDRLPSPCGCRFLVLGGGEDAGEPLPDALHAKLYAIERDEGQILYLGSANATHSAFARNIEVLVRLEAQLDTQEFLEQFVPYAKSGAAVAEDAGRKTFEALCRAVVRSFRVIEQADAHYYSAAQLEGVTLQLNGAQGQEGPNASSRLWRKTQAEKHMVQLTITDRDQRQNDVFLLVEGEPIPCDREGVCMACLTACFDGQPSPAAERETGGDGDSPSAPAKTRLATYSDLILTLRDADTAKRVMQVAKSCLADQNADETARAYWQAVEAGIRSAFFEDGE